MMWQRAGDADTAAPRGAALKEVMRHRGQRAAMTKVDEGKGDIVGYGTVVGMIFVEGAVNVTGPTECTCQESPAINHWTMCSGVYLVPSRKGPMGLMDGNTVLGAPWVRPVNRS